MKGSLTPRILAGPLAVALLAAPGAFREEMAPLWVSRGLPLLAALGLFAAALAFVAGPLALARRIARRSESPIGERGALEGSADAGAAEDEGGAPEEAAKAAAAAGGKAGSEPDVALGEALSELRPENYLDLARALQEMDRDAEALEVLARVVERGEGSHGGEVAAALRRLRGRLQPPGPAGA